MIIKYTRKVMLKIELPMISALSETMRYLALKIIVASSLASTS
ncbi:MAG: hypothetical protein WC310_04735 [Patescibacteria group bacterium]